MNITIHFNNGQFKKYQNVQLVQENEFFVKFKDSFGNAYHLNFEHGNIIRVVFSEHGGDVIVTTPHYISCDFLYDIEFFYKGNDNRYPRTVKNVKVFEFSKTHIKYQFPESKYVALLDYDKEGIEKVKVYNDYCGELNYMTPPEKVNTTMNNGLKDHSEVTGKFIVGSISDDGTFSIAPNPVLHNTIKIASREAERLAKKHSKRFVVMECKGSVVTTGVKWD